MNELKSLLREIFKDVPQIKNQTIEVRIDEVDHHFFHYENGIDVRISIKNLKLLQKLLKDEEN